MWSLARRWHPTACTVACRVISASAELFILFVVDSSTVGKYTWYISTVMMSMTAYIH